MDETPDQLRVTLGQGITGWVAANRLAQNLGDAASDPRANTIPGTEDDLDESMLLAPMVFDDQVLGVLVLSKLGLYRFSDDDLRLLVIYASFAAQAMANADTTERLREQTLALEQQLRGQRELLLITESILTTLDARGVLESITERLGRLIASDNVAIEVVDPATALLTPLTARGVHAAYYLEPWAAGETGVATWVLEHNEPVLIGDEQADPRVNHFRDELGSVEGSLIVVPLRGRGGAIGVLTIERLGKANTFSAEEFELVQLFAAQVSIALQNAEVFQAVEIRARTDDLTGLLNHGTFEEWLDRSVREGAPFSLIMLDLDDFRNVNNDLGHQAGDKLLRRIADGLVRAGRESDLVFRYGGDEFTFILPHTDAAGALQVAERARQAVSATERAGQRIGRRGDVPGRRSDRDGRPAGRRPRLLRRQARWPRPDRDRGRGPRPGGRAVAPGPDARGLGDLHRGLRRRDPNLARGVTMVQVRSQRLRPWILAGSLLMAACVPDPAPRPGESVTPAPPTPTPVPTPAGPTPTPSFVRPTPTPQPTFLVYTVHSGDTLEADRTEARDVGPEHRLLEPRRLPDARPRIRPATSRTSSVSAGRSG